MKIFVFHLKVPIGFFRFRHITSYFTPKTIPFFSLSESVRGIKLQNKQNERGLHLIENLCVDV